MSPWRLISETTIGGTIIPRPYHQTQLLLCLICMAVIATPFAVLGMDSVSNGPRTRVLSEGYEMEKGIDGRAGDERK